MDMTTRTAIAIKACRHCARDIAYRTDSVWRSGWTHVADNTQLCGNEMAAPLPHCPNCDNTNLIFTAQAWSNDTDCPDCGYHSYASIGD
jgi:predicted RNA-binding Zn-ribbon protein involved in translation (DUF1610 family)